MAQAKGTSVPFFTPVVSPRLRDEALLQAALRHHAAGHAADALVAVEAVCRRQPRSALPGLLGAQLLAEACPSMAVAASYRAWLRDPTHATLQDALLSAWLAGQAKESVIALGQAFLPQRLREGTAPSLLALLQRAGATYAAACWKSEFSADDQAPDKQAGNNASPPAGCIEGRVFRFALPGGTVRLRLLAEEEAAAGLAEAEFHCTVPADGSLFRLPLPSAATAWSVALADQPGGACLPLPGSPLVFAAPALASPAKPRSAARSKPRPPPRRTGGTDFTGRTPIDIVIPVYRDADGVSACVQSVLASLPANRVRAEIVVIDDASPELQLSSWLDELAGQGRITLLRNRCNLGFIETVNRGMRLHPERNVVLLNADTLVHGDWLDRLDAALHAADDIASVTPWSNNGEISSVPHIGQAAAAPTAQQLALIDQAAARLHRAGKTADQPLPGCCGFAMLMRRSVLDRIGLFDAAGLQRGYSEEVDWCLRATAAGYRHRLASGVFVAHAGGASFRFEKALRVRQNRQVIHARYPSYYADYHRFLREDPLRPARDRLLAELTRAVPAWPPAPQTPQAPLLPRSPQATQSPGDAHLALQPAPLPAACLRIAVLQPRSAASHRKLLALARALAARRLPVRLLVIGAASEALWHTGVADVLPDTGDEDSSLISDAMLLGLTGCRTVLMEQPQALPATMHGVHSVRIDEKFSPDAWLTRWIGENAQALRQLQRVQRRTPAAA